MTRLLTGAAVALLFTTAVAHADRAAADRCAAALPPASHALYEASPAEVGGEAVRDALTGNAREMVMGGTLSRANAQAAAPCLMQAK